ncbi:hypothetical protein AcV5_009475 [Taiwanofungus camphoratus]|nr:hypothetical protein AcV5_009475 [Antrodia cinnamomea]
MASLSILSALFILVSRFCLAQFVSPRPPSGNRITDLSTRVDIPHEEYRFASGSGDNQLDLLDIVLVASVDGKLHALNRTSGDSIWSMASSSGASPATLGPLVRTQHPDIDPDLIDDDSIHHELYVVEPQTGDIYVMSSSDSPLQRLPFSVPQLVDMSPFSFPAEDDGRVFVGKKETSLLLVELETGRVKATLNSECPWDPFESLGEPVEFDLDLDELDGTKPPKFSSNPTEVFIGRTDYYISIYTRPARPSAVRPPVQNLTFSTYGPNNQDHALQSLYRHTADNAYIEPLPNGKIISFKSGSIDVPHSDVSPNTHLLWGQAFPNPVVAVFDVLEAPNRPHPFVLLQPRMRLQDILPRADLRAAAAQNRLNPDTAYVGLIEESGSLFALSPVNFPLVVFGDADAGLGRTLDPPEGLLEELDVSTGQDLPGDVDAVTRRAKARRFREMCREGSTDRRCLTGVRRLGTSSESRLSRLLDGVPSVPLPSNQHYNSQESEAKDNFSTIASVRTASGGRVSNILLWESEPDGLSNSGRPLHTLSAFALSALVLLAAFIWLALNKATRKQSSSSSRVASGKVEKVVPSQDVSTIEQVHANEALATGSDVHAGATAAARSSTAPPPRATTPGIPGKEVDLTADSEEFQTPPRISANLTDDAAEGEDSDKEEDAPATPGKRKGLRRKRGKKRKGGLAGNGAAGDTEPEKKGDDIDKREAVQGNGRNGVPEPEGRGNDTPQVGSPSAIVLPSSLKHAATVPSLIVSDTILGFGSHGTVVYKGSLQGRAVAVKRLLQDFVTLYSREVNILQESDDHPNVIRYYYQEAHANFLYIALELCPASLADVIERPDDFRDIALVFDPKRALRQITAGLRHLHALKIVHRDIKPQNILISHAKKGAGESAGHRMLISDFGLCKKLEVDQTSFLPTGHGAMGTVGWRAPEILRGEVKLDEAGADESQSSRGSVGSSGGTPTGKPTRLTKSVDIFALGCLYYYVLTNGGHPFGDRFEREVNILKNAKSLDGLERFGEEGSEGADLISRMLSPEAYDRPDTSTCLLHPYFWDPGKRLNFLQDASDRFEIMCRDPRDPNLILLETGAFNVVGNDWHFRLDKLFIENLGKFRKYDGKSVQDLLRALRNKKHHYQDLPDNVKRLLGSMPDGFLSYFTRRFPGLFLHVHSVISVSPLRNESMFQTYFELND